MDQISSSPPNAQRSWQVGLRPHAQRPQYCKRCREADPVPRTGEGLRQTLLALKKRNYRLPRTQHISRISQLPGKNDRLPRTQHVSRISPLPCKIRPILRRIRTKLTESKRF